MTIKIGRILKYHSGPRDLVPPMGYTGTGTVKGWVDAQFAVHHDMTSHTSGMVSMGRASLYSASNKQKLNTKNLDLSSAGGGG